MANVKKAFTGELNDLVDPYVQVSFAGLMVRISSEYTVRFFRNCVDINKNLGHTSVALQGTTLLLLICLRMFIPKIRCYVNNWQFNIFLCKNTT